jgi:hypothetical protein
LKTFLTRTKGSFNILSSILLRGLAVTCKPKSMVAVILLVVVVADGNRKVKGCEVNA